MERENTQLETVIDLGAASVETKGPFGDPVDDLQGIARAGLSED
jgi:hypothetical protein